MAQAAYDLTYFDRPERQPRPRVRVAKRRKSESRRQLGRMLRTLLAVSLLVTLVCAVLYTQTTINELQRAIVRMDKQLTDEQSTYAYLSFELENMSSMKNIEERAAQLGMEKISSNQITYFKVESGDGIVVKENPLAKLFNEAKNGLLDIAAGLVP